jgi:broad specificity phosphatase PhoE
MAGCQKSSWNRRGRCRKGLVPCAWSRLPALVLIGASVLLRQWLSGDATIGIRHGMVLAMANSKRIVFLRHGCTYMNEYLGRGVSFGEPGFSDVFDPDTERMYYRDSPLSKLGRAQAKALGSTNPKFLKGCELIVTSPLTRALQTLDAGLWAPMSTLGVQDQIPIVASPLAAERLYLISDVGRAVDELATDFDYVDFETGFVEHPSDLWWYHPPDDGHLEWRPVGQGQRYACPGEPEHAFNARMNRLYEWLRQRPERKVAVVCHWGVIKWMLGTDFGNCQWREVGLDDLKPARAADGSVHSRIQSPLER